MRGWTPPGSPSLADLHSLTGGLRRPKRRVPRHEVPTAMCPPARFRKDLAISATKVSQPGHAARLRHTHARRHRQPSVSPSRHGRRLRAALTHHADGVGGTSPATVRPGGPPVSRQAPALHVSTAPDRSPLPGGIVAPTLGSPQIRRARSVYLTAPAPTHSCDCTANFAQRCASPRMPCRPALADRCALVVPLTRCRTPSDLHLNRGRFRDGVAASATTHRHGERSTESLTDRKVHVARQSRRRRQPLGAERRNCLSRANHLVGQRDTHVVSGGVTDIG